MRSPRRATIAALLATCLCALLLQACGADAPAAPASAASADTSIPAATPTPKPATTGKIGEPVVADGTTITVSKVSTDTKLIDGQKARASDIFVIAEVQIENSGADAASYGQYDFTIKDSAGKEYKNVVTLDSHFLRQGDLAKGEKANGILAFAVGKDAKGLQLLYKHLSGAPIQIQLQ